MDCLKRFSLAVCLLATCQISRAEEPKTPVTVTATTMPPAGSHAIPSISGNRAPLIVNRDERSARPTDGTFGYDVRRPFFFTQQAVNRLTHYTPDRREGGYKTEGKHLFDILAVRPIKKSLHPEKHEEEHGGHGGGEQHEKEDHKEPAKKH